MPIPLAGFEPAIPASEWQQTLALDRSATGIHCVQVTARRSFVSVFARSSTFATVWSSSLILCSAAYQWAVYYLHLVTTCLSRLQGSYVQDELFLDILSSYNVFIEGVQNPRTTKTSLFLFGRLHVPTYFLTFNQLSTLFYKKATRGQ